MIIDLLLLYRRQYYIGNHGYIYSDPALHNHMSNLDRLSLLHSHMLDLSYCHRTKLCFKSYLDFITSLVLLAINSLVILEIESIDAENSEGEFVRSNAVLRTWILSEF